VIKSMNRKEKYNIPTASAKKEKTSSDVRKRKSKRRIERSKRSRRKKKKRKKNRIAAVLRVSTTADG